MLNAILYNKDVPVLYWDTSNNMFGVLDTDKVPEEIYDHLWQYIASEIHPESRVRNNVRVVSKWLATKSNQPQLHIESLMHSIAKQEVGQIELMSYDLGTDWEIHLTNEVIDQRVIMY